MLDPLPHSHLRRGPVTGDAKWLLNIPYDSGLVGAKFYAQVAIIDLGAPSSWLLTNAHEGTIGSQ